MTQSVLCHLIWSVISLALITLCCAQPLPASTHEHHQQLEKVVTIAWNFPGKTNISHIQTKYHLARARTNSFSCSNATHSIKYSQNHLSASVDLSNCSCSSSSPIGTAAYTDWALLLPCLFRYDATALPRTVYVQTALLPFFATQLLPVLPSGRPFVLISGGMDLTVPRQIDKRYRPLEGFKEAGSNFTRLLNSSRILHWYAENRDVSDGYEKFSTWPTGLSFVKKLYPDDMSDLVRATHQTGAQSLPNKPLQVLVSDRLHGENNQMHLRREVRALCNRTPTCRSPKNDTDIKHSEFMMEISQVSFVACIQGGGIDPSPKAWETILAGSIPIIKTSWLDDAYRQLPVVLVEDWDQVFFSEALVDKLYPQYFARVNNGSLGMMASSERAVNDTLYEEARRVYEERLEKWRAQLAPYYEVHSGKRREVLRRLQSAYWMNQVYDRLDRYDEAHGVSPRLRAVRRTRLHPVTDEGLAHISGKGHGNHTDSTALPVNQSSFPRNLAVFASFNAYPVWVGPGTPQMHTQSTFERIAHHISSAVSSVDQPVAGVEGSNSTTSAGRRRRGKTPSAASNATTTSTAGVNGTTSLTKKHRANRNQTKSLNVTRETQPRRDASLTVNITSSVPVAPSPAPAKPSRHPSGLFSWLFH